MLRFAIAEDDYDDYNNLASAIKYVEKKLGVSTIVDHFDTGVKLLASFECNYDIIFLDIEMPGLNGMETARKIREKDKNVIVIFITNLIQMAVDGYEVEAFDFIVKPINHDTFLMKLERAISRINTSSSESIMVKCKGEIFSIRIDSIKYIESDDHYLIYHTLDGTYREYATLKDVEKRINNKAFARCNQCFLVNLKYVSKFVQNDVFIGDTPLNMSRPQKKAFIEKYFKYIGGDL